MRGGAQSQLMLGADGNLWVVKFRNNPQGVRVLANELIATKLAEAVGLSVPATDAVDVSGWLIQNSPEMWVDVGKGEHERCAAGLAFGSQFENTAELSMDFGRSQEKCLRGLQFGSRYVGGLMPGQVVDYLPDELMGDVRNLSEFAGMLCLDKWTGNSNGRQAVFVRKPRERKYRAVFIDQGYCFHANEWTFPDSPLRGVFPRNLVYEGVTGWDSFEPWLTRMEEMPAETLWGIAEVVPPEWYGGDPAELEQLMEALLKRRSRVRELVTAFRESSREPFPKWGMGRSVVVPGSFAASSVASKFVM